jgi:hypothetical protein
MRHEAISRVWKEVFAQRGDVMVSRLVLIVDEVRPGVYVPDFTTRDMHPAKAATVLGDLSKKLFAHVKDDQERREIVNKEKEIRAIVSGQIDLPPFQIDERESQENEL